MVTAGTATRVLVRLGSASACALAVHTAVNLLLLRRPSPDAPDVAEEVAVLIPARDEERHLAATLQSVLATCGVPRLSVLVLDDGSSDATSGIVGRAAAADSRVMLIEGPDEAPPAGWLGKPWACQRLADEAAAPILVFIDADVALRPEAIRAMVAMLRDHDLAMVAPYPRQLAESWLERLVQPLVTWSWAATLPVRWAERSLRPSLSAANGQFIVIDAAAYQQAGGHHAVRADVIEDVALMRAVKASGRHAATVDGSDLSHCRMYDDPRAVVDGYAKSLWSAFNGPVGSAAVNAFLLLTFLVPAIGALAARDRRTRCIGAIGYSAGVASRAMVARRTGERVLPDCLAHPASIAGFAALNVISWNRHIKGGNTWKGRPVRVAA
jgi:GT2 family glycosyltransferase